MRGFDGIQRDRYFEGELIRKTEIEVRMGKLKNGKAAGKEKVTGEVVKGRGDIVVDLIWRLFLMAFESGVVPENWIYVVIILFFKGKGERTEYNNYRGMSLLSGAKKIYAEILVDRIHKVTEGLIDIEQGGFKSGDRGV